MLSKIRDAFVVKVNKNPLLKKGLLCLYNYYYDARPVVVGWLIRIPAYIQNLLYSKVIAKPGTLGFRGGAFNPGALCMENGEILLLAKSQVLPWYKARGKYKKHYLLGAPISGVLNEITLTISKPWVINALQGFPSPEEFAIEDFRMFWWKGKRIVNHSFIDRREITSGNQSLVKPALSLLNDQQKTLELIGFPQLDFPVEQVEKNWLYGEKKGQLFLFYSVSPYRVLRLDNEADWYFSTVIDRDVPAVLQDPGGFGTRVSFSTNPIDFDEQHWLVLIHQIKHQVTGRCYYHWALLIDKETLQPSKITSKPIFSGMGTRGRVPGYRYISSVLKKGDELLFFAGEGDVYVTLTTKKIDAIERYWIPI